MKEDSQSIVERLNSDNFIQDELPEWLEHGGKRVQIFAIIAVIRKHIVTDDINRLIYKIAIRFRNEPGFFFSWKTSHFALAALKMLGRSDTMDLYNQALKYADKYTEDDIGRLIKRIEHDFLLKNND